jgi:hypothetical protein
MNEFELLGVGILNPKGHRIRNAQRASRSAIGRRLSVFKYRSRAELWGLCNDHLLFHQRHNEGLIFRSLSRRDKVQGGCMSISIPDKMDDYARDCVVRLADRVDDKMLRERLLQMAREWKAAATDEGNRSSAVT